MFKGKLLDVVLGSGGVAAVEVVQQVGPIDPTLITEIGGLIIQIAIGIVTLFKMLKKKSSEK